MTSRTDSSPRNRRPTVAEDIPEVAETPSWRAVLAFAYIAARPEVEDVVLSGGGGKRDLHSFDDSVATTGISIDRGPYVDPDLYYVYDDPLESLPAGG